MHGPLRLACDSCHKGAAKTERAGFPTRADCLACHRTFRSDRIGESLPSRRVYRVADFVFFSHARHHAASVECSSCHGAVTARDLVRVERPATMKACMDCHKQRGATLGCNACHELGQD